MVSLLLDPRHHRKILWEVFRDDSTDAFLLQVFHTVQFFRDKPCTIIIFCMRYINGENILATEPMASHLLASEHLYPCSFVQSRTVICRVYTDWCGKKTWKCLVGERGQRIMGRLVKADKKALVTQITTLYYHDKQKRISERSTCRTVRWTDYNSRRLHQDLLLSAKNRSLSLQWAQEMCPQVLLKTGQLKIGKILPDLIQ